MAWRPVAIGRCGYVALVLAMLPVKAWCASLAPAAQFGAWPRSDQEGEVLSVVAERLVIECSASGEVLECRSRSELEVENAAQTPVTLRLDLEVLDGVSLMVDGRAVALDRPEGSTTLVGRATFRAPPERSRVVVTCPRALRFDTNPSTVTLAAPALVVRHPLLGQYPGAPAAAQVPLVSVDSAGAWHEVRHSQIILRYPRRWSTHPLFADCGSRAPTSQGCGRALPDGDRELEWRFVPDKTNREVVLEPHSSYFSNGGVLLGTAWGGGAGCLDCVEAFRVRAGYEIGLDDWGLFAVAGEFSTDSRITVVPTLDRVRWLPRFVHPFPTITAGFGVPVRVNPSARVGGRFQASLTWSVASAFSVGTGFLADLYVTAQDLYPELAMMLQLGI